MEKFPQREQGRARDKAAELVGASPRYVQDAKQIAKDAPEILDHVKQGTLALSPLKLSAQGSIKIEGKAR